MKIHLKIVVLLTTIIFNNGQSTSSPDSQINTNHPVPSAEDLTQSNVYIQTRQFAPDFAKKMIDIHLSPLHLYLDYSQSEQVAGSSSEDMETAESSIVFLPLFAQRRKNEQRRRIAAKRRNSSTPSPVSATSPQPTYSYYTTYPYYYPGYYDTYYYPPSNYYYSQQNYVSWYYPYYYY